MLSTLLTSVFALSSLSFAASISNARRQNTGVVRLPVAAQEAASVLSWTSKRQTVSVVDNVQTGTRYVVEFSIGTPPQSISLSLDTGSSETWVNPDCSAAGSAESVTLCGTYPKYNPTTSSSTVDLNSEKTLNYGKGSADVEYYKDTFLIGADNVLGQQFGVATTSSEMPTGLMGVGPGVELTGYPIIIDSLATQGFTKSRAFSLDLRGFESAEGAIIFGGIDTGKFSGKLEKCPIIPATAAPDGQDRYWIQMASVGITKPGQTLSSTYASSSTPVFLDSGGTLSRLPTAVFNAILADFPGATDAGGVYSIPCDVGNQAGSVDFTFGATVINVPYSEFIWHLDGACYLGVVAEDAAPVLGDSFLRAAFVVYDQDNQNLLLANAANCGTTLVEIGTGPDAVPSVLGDCPAASVTSSSSSSSVSSTSSTPVPTSTSSSSVTTSTSSTSSSIPITTSTFSSIPVTSSTSSTSAIITPSTTSSVAISTTAIPTTAPETTPLSSSSCSKTSSFVYYANTTSTYAVPTFKPTITSVVPVEYPSTTPYTMSTVYATSVYTITSCAATVTDCPARVGQVTTDVVFLYTTYCPVAAEATTTPLAVATTYPAPVPTTELGVPTSPVAESTYVAPYPVSSEASPSSVASYTTVTSYSTSSHYITVPVIATTTRTSTAAGETIVIPVSLVSTSSSTSIVISYVTVKPVAPSTYSAAPTYSVASASSALGVVAPSGTGTGPVYTSSPIPFTGAASVNKSGGLLGLGLTALGFLILM